MASLLRNDLGTGISLGLLAPELSNDPRLQDEWARYERIVATPTGVIAGFEMSRALDVRDLPPSVAVPTLIVHSVTNGAIPSSHGRYHAEHIPGARYLETDGAFLFELDDRGPGGDIAEFLTGSRMAAQVDRSLLVVLFTDIANSTDRVAAIGDTAWRAMSSMTFAAWYATSSIGTTRRK